MPSHDGLARRACAADVVRGNLRRRCVITPIYDQLAHFLTIQSGDVTSQNRLAAGVQTVVAGKTGNKVHRLFVATGHGQVLGLSCRRGAPNEWQQSADSCRTALAAGDQRLSASSNWRGST